jgi:hypothetical protein
MSFLFALPREKERLGLYAAAALSPKPAVMPYMETHHQGTFTFLDSVSIAPRLSVTVRTTV